MLPNSQMPTMFSTWLNPLITQLIFRTSEALLFSTFRDDQTEIQIKNMYLKFYRCTFHYTTVHFINDTH